MDYIEGLVQDCGNSSASAMELPQLCTKPCTYNIMLFMTHRTYGGMQRNMQQQDFQITKK